MPENGYVEVITYDKELQHKLKYTYEDYEYVENLDDFKGVFRSEVRIKNRKLNQNKRSQIWGLSKDLVNYLNEDMKSYYWRRYAEKVWFTEDFYRIDVAIKIIQNNKSISESMKKKFIDVLKRINKYGFTNTREYYAHLKVNKQISALKKLSASSEKINSMKNKKLRSQDYSTFDNYIKRIRNLNINPLTFDKCFKLEKIENFSRYNVIDNN